METKLNQAVQEQQESLRTYVHQIKMQKHDFNTQLSTICYLAKNQSYQRLVTYIEEMLDEHEDFNQTIVLSIPEISALLYRYEKLAKKKGLSIELNLNTTLEYLPMSFYKFNKILGNIISNALEAAEKSIEKKVHIEIDEQIEEFIIKVTNSGEINEKILNSMYEPEKTSKTEKEHGFGLAIVKSLLDEIKGEIHFISTTNTVSCLVSIPKGEN